MTTDGTRIIPPSAFAGKATATLAAQCRMQARDNLDPEYSRFMIAVADRLDALASPVAKQDQPTIIRAMLRFATETQPVASPPPT